MCSITWLFVLLVTHTLCVTSTLTLAAVLFTRISTSTSRYMYKSTNSCTVWNKVCAIAWSNQLHIIIFSCLLRSSYFSQFFIFLFFFNLSFCFAFVNIYDAQHIRMHIWCRCVFEQYQWACSGASISISSFVLFFCSSYSSFHRCVVLCIQFCADIFDASVRATFKSGYVQCLSLVFVFFFSSSSLLHLVRRIRYFLFVWSWH